MRMRGQRPRPYLKTGVHRLKRAVQTLGSRALPSRSTALGRALHEWRTSLIADLGGTDAVSTQQLALVELAVRTKLLVDSVDAHAGDQRFAPHVLAALASRGSNRALNLLAGHLDDERPYVRRWTLDAFRFSLRRDLAQATLQAVSGELKFADTRRATVDLLQQWQKGGDQNP